MNKNKLPVRFTGQHFTVNAALIKYAIELAEIQSCDIVFDLGGGRGYITDQLLKRTNNVIVLENDDILAAYLQKKYSRKSGVTVKFNDIRKYLFPNTVFKVVSSIPYALTSHILKELMYTNLCNFQGGSIITQLEPAQKIISESNHNPYSIFYKTFYDISLVKQISRESFNPPPSVKSALLSIKKREHSIVTKEFSDAYLGFLFFMLKQPELKILTVLNKIFQKKQIRFLTEKYSIELNKPIILFSVEQWANCFMEMNDIVPKRYHPQI